MDYYLNNDSLVREIKNVKIGDFIYFSGIMYTMRDKAHRIYMEKINNKEDILVDFQDAVIYYSGPSPKRDSDIVGAIGPTTSYRMDLFSPFFYDLGVKLTIGKGNRSKDVQESITSNGALYGATFGGAGAYLSNTIEEFSLVDLEELGPEAIYRLKVKDFPIIVINDTWGNDYYASLNM